MPIGLPGSGPRSADLLAAPLVVPGSSAVFLIPVQAALLAPDHASATAINREATNSGVSAQAFALRTRLL